MPYELYKKLGKSDTELVKTNMTLSGVRGKKPIEAKGVTSMELTIGSKMIATAFFVAEVEGDKGQKREDAMKSKQQEVPAPTSDSLANGQAESSNKMVINLIKKKIGDYPRRWHEVLSEALWAHRISKHRATKVSPFKLVYGQDAMLPVEVNLDAYRFVRQNDLDVGEYLMMDNIDEVTDKRLMALKEIEKDKLMVAKAYNKKVKVKNFQVGELVWKTVLPLKTKD
ncbi:uncharacterized protein LOC120640230 [Panicum virgatum]|uniref:uncharacterized protein LOC120640230 n=1 Tax=Panicum virgatum TaxID=38727 RepID=UPI0019D504C2|nr:uncharacterized protein LOC120640230 [Panicum virgatum]